MYHQALQRLLSDATQPSKYPSSIAVFYGNICFQRNSLLKEDSCPDNFGPDWQ